MDKQMIRERGQLMVTDDDFNMLLEDVATSEKRFAESEPTDAIMAKMLVFSKHKYNEKYELIPMLLAGFPPDPNGLVSRFDVLQLVGAKYCTEMVKQKEAGKKHFPLAIFLLNEAWIRKFPADEIDERKSLAEYPDSQEVLFITGMTIDARENGALMRIKRNKQNHIFLSDIKYQKYGGRIESGSDLTKAFFIGFTKELDNIQP